ncbi:unnamed protein product [Alternaria sp. RS040]
MTRPTRPQTDVSAGCQETRVDDKGVFGAYVLKGSHPALCALSNLFDETTTPPETSPNELEDDVDFIIKHFAPICSQAPAEFNLYHNQICGAWVEMLPLVVEPAKNSPFLYFAIRTMATALRTHTSVTRGNISRILLMYGDSLRRVGKALEEAQGVFQHEHCVAILCLSATNIVIPQARSDWATHAKGVGAMIERLGPKPFSTGILHTLFVGFRPLLTFLAQDGWVTTPFETVPISIMQLLLNKATQLPALLERFDGLGDRSEPSNVVAMQRLRDDVLYMIKSLKDWELSSKTQAKFSLVWPKPDSPEAESSDRKALWFANVLVASSLTHCWAFEIVARQHLDDIEESIAEIKGCNVKAVPRRSDCASDEDENPVSILAEKICDSMPYFLQPELKLYGPASTFFTFLTAMKVFKHKKTYCASRLSRCQQVIDRLASIGIHFPSP